MPDPEALSRVMGLTGLSGRDLWLRYLALGGGESPGKVMTHIAVGGILDDFQHDILVHALNERFMEMGLDHPVPYSESPVAPPPADS
jgi:hypothetical protein